MMGNPVTSNVMARNGTTHPPAHSADAATSEDVPVAPETLLELLEDDHTQAVLSSIAAEAKPARAILEEVTASRATVYRRLNSLEEAGLVESGIDISGDGHHRQTYRTVLSDVVVSVEPDGLSVTVETDR
jgi:Transcriptional regulator PadR-like family.